MANKYGPRIIDDGLVLCIDAAGDNKTYPVDGLDVEYLVVAGGGGGGSRDAGGGGAGGLLIGSTQTTIASGTYPIVIGAGGTGGVGNTTSPSNGSNSTAFGDTAIGGGRGGQNPTNYASTGGSGGGGRNTTGGAAGTAGQGYKGGDGDTPYSAHNGGGGGGAGGEGGDSLSDEVSGGDGGIGRYFGDRYGTSLGENGWFAGGGGAGGEQGGSTNGTGGLGGGGNGHLTAAEDGQINTGGGGGSNRNYATGLVAGDGGSGIVLIRYSGPPRAKGGDSIISHKGYTIHVFTSSGNFIVGETAADLSTSKKYGTLTNMSSSDYTRGRSGYFSFDGSNQYIDCGIDNTLFKFSAGDSISVIAAVKPTNINQQTYQAFFTIGGDPDVTRDRSYQMRITNYGGSGKIDALYRDSTNTVWNIIKTNNAYAVNNQWIIIASTYTYKTGSSWKIYVNGQQVSTTFQSGNGNYDPIVNTNQIFVGIGEDANNTTEQWYGQIGFVQMYRSYLTSDQILNNFNAIRGRYGL